MQGIIVSGDASKRTIDEAIERAYKLSYTVVRFDFQELKLLLEPPNPWWLRHRFRSQYSDHLQPHSQAPPTFLHIPVIVGFV